MQLKIMTFNLRTSFAKGDGKNSFSERKPNILSVITQHAPDLIGFQEVTDEMLRFLRESLSSEYEIISCGREHDLHGEGVTVAYRRNGFTALRYETFWLSPTPEIFGSTYGGDQSSCPRVTTYVVLKADGVSEPFVFANTHFDHKGEIAKLRSAEQMTSFFEKCSYPIFFTGDFNSQPDDAPILRLKEILTDLTEDVGGTFHNFGAQGYEPIKIDYIFTSIQEPLFHSELVTGGISDGVYPSDHYPVVSTVEYN